MNTTLTVTLKADIKDYECRRLIAQIALLDGVVGVVQGATSPAAEMLCPHGVPLDKPCALCGTRYRGLDTSTKP